MTHDPWTCLTAVLELKQMAGRKVTTDADAKAYLLRTKLVLQSLSPADQFDIEQMYRELLRGQRGR